MTVVDASVVANALADDGADGAAARAALRRAEPLAAPDLVDVETVSVLRRHWRAGDLTAQRFRRAIADLRDLAILRHPTLPFMQRAYELRANVTPYDAAYIALAEARNETLLTADTRLARSPGIRCKVVVVTV